MIKKIRTQKVFGLILFMLLLGVYSRPVSAAAGRPDFSFGGDGIVTTPLAAGAIGSATGIIVQPDGKPVVAVFAVGQGNFEMAVIRYNLDGTLDTSFSGDGIFNTPFIGNDAVANAIARQTDGKIIVAGPLITELTGSFFVLRLNADGTLDTSFDSDGIAVHTALDVSDGKSVAIQPDGKILVAGHAFSGGEDYFSVTRLNSNGSVDTAFGTGGSSTVSFGPIDFLYGMTLQTDGKIVLLGDADVSSSSPYLAMVRFNSNGTPDNTFDGDGRVTTQISGLSAQSIVQQPDGKLLVGGALGSDFAVLRYNPNGSLDTGFGGDGIAATSFGPTGAFAHNLVVQPDNKIVAVGETAIGDNFLDLDMAVARFNANGSLDIGFGTGGRVVTRISESSDLANAVALQPDGKIIAAGTGTELGTRQVTLVRYLNQGSTGFDFDGDAKTDISIFRPGAGEWWINQSSAGATVAAQFGQSADRPVPADFTGDGKTDIAFWRSSSGEWFILRSEDGSFFSFPFGSNGDIPVVGDFDADGKADPSIFRQSTGEWYILKSTGGAAIVTFGTTGDAPVPADYDGDGKTDIAIFRPSDGSWWYLRSSDLQNRVYRFGVSTDKPVQGDYTGDGFADIAIFRPSTGEWFVQRSEDNSFYSVPFGTNGDLPAPGDYDGDGKFDTAVFRPSGSTWYVNRSTAGILITNFGITGDRPIPNIFVP